MARKPLPPPQQLSLTPIQIRQAIERIGKRVAELEAFQPGEVIERRSAEVRALTTAIDETLSKVFGQGTPAYLRYHSAARLDSGPIYVGRGEENLGQVRQWLTQGKDRALALLGQAIKGLEEDLADAGGEMFEIPALKAKPIEVGDEVFIVHGHDTPAKTEVARLIERAGLKAVILHEQPNQGRTIIEKFEAYGAAAGFAVVIATPDDLGGIDADHLQARARQNVVGEMFWFAGRLGRSRVCALLKGKIEMPSDFAGVGYTDMDERGAWKAELLRELSAAGYPIDWGKALA